MRLIRLQGDPSSAMLEETLLHDNYLEVGYDLSKVMFVATVLSSIQPAQRLMVILWKRKQLLKNTYYPSN